MPLRRPAGVPGVAKGCKAKGKNGKGQHAGYEGKGAGKYKGKGAGDHCKGAGKNNGKGHSKGKNDGKGHVGKGKGDPLQGWSEQEWDDWYELQRFCPFADWALLFDPYAAFIREMFNSYSKLHGVLHPQ